MRKALLVVTPLMLAGLILYAVWEPVSTPATRGQKNVPGVRDLEDVAPQARIPEGDRESLRVRASEMETPGRLTIEEYREVLEQLERRQANSLRMIAARHEVIEKTRSELTRKTEFARLQTSYIEEIKYRLAAMKLESGQFKKKSGRSGSSSGLWSLTTGGTSLILYFDGYVISFEFLPAEFPGLFAMMNQRVDAEAAILQFQCDEFNRLPIEDRNMRIGSHFVASEMLRVLQPDYMSTDARRSLRNNVLPSFMVIDKGTHTVRPR